MMNNFKKVLLTGTALIATAGFAASAQAVDLGSDTTLSGNVAVNTAYDLKGFNLTVDETQTNALGAITDTGTTPDGNVTFDANAGAGASATITVDSINLGSTTGNVVVQATEATGGDVDATAVTVTNDLTAVNVTLTAGANNAADHVTLTVGGNLTATTTLDDDASNGTATLTLNGSTAQVVTGVVTASSANEGTLVINNSASTVTFGSAVGGTALGTITVTDATETVFQSTVAANAMTVAAGKDVEFDDAATIATLTLADDATTELQFAGSSAQTFTGAIEGTNGADGILNVDNSTTFVGTVGATQSIAAMDIATAQTATLDTTGTANQIDTTTINGTGIFVIDASDASGTSTLTGDVVAGGDSEGTLRFTGTKGVTVTGAVGASGTDLTAIQVNALSDTMTVTLDGDVYAEGVSISATGADDANFVVLGGGSGDTVNISGDITVATTNTDEHTLTLDAATATAVTGNIGTSTATFLNVDIESDTTIGGNIYATTVTGDSALTLNGSSAQTVSGSLDLTGGDLAVSNSTGVTFAGAITNVAAATVSGAATYDASATFTGAYTNTGGTTTVGATSTVTALSFTDDGSYVLQADGSDIGKLADSAAAAVLTESNVTIDVTGAVDAGTVNNVLSGFTLTGATLVDNSLLYSFAVDNSGNVTVAKTDNSTYSSTSTAGVAAALDTLGTAGDSTLDAIQDALALKTSGDDVNDLLESTVSDVSGGAMVAGLTVSNQTAQITGQRLASLRTGGATGMAAGDNMSNGLKAWAQAFGSTADQDQRDGVAGYDADSAGFALGMDTEVGDNAVVGLALSYANTDVEGEDVNQSETEVDTYQVTLYGDMDIDSRTFVSGQVSYALGKNDTTRKNVGGTSSVARGDFDSDQFGIRAEAGRSYESDYGLTLTPSVLANYVHYDADNYTETGASGANLTVDSEALNVFELGANLEVSTVQEFANGSSIKPVLNLGVRHDLIGDEFESSNTFTGGGSAFKVKGFDPAQTTFNAGTGVTYFSADQWELSAQYDYEVKSDYQAHSGMVKAAYKF